MSAHIVGKRVEWLQGGFTLQGTVTFAAFERETHSFVLLVECRGVLYQLPATSVQVIKSP